MFGFTGNDLHCVFSYHPLGILVVSKLFTKGPQGNSAACFTSVLGEEQITTQLWVKGQTTCAVTHDAGSNCFVDDMRHICELLSGVIGS